MPYENNHSHCDEVTDLPFGISGHQNYHWKKEIDEKGAKEQPFKLFNSLNVVCNLFRYVGIPDQHKLRKP